MLEEAKEFTMLISKKPDARASISLPRKGVRKSLKPVTLEVVKSLRSFLEDQANDGSWGNHYRRTEVWTTSQARHFVHSIYETKAFHLVIPDDETIPPHYVVSVGNRFDKGQPHGNVKERINGILDALSGYGLAPEGLRIFKDPNADGVTVIGIGTAHLEEMKNMQYYQMGQAGFNTIHIETDDTKFNVIGATSSMTTAKFDLS